MVHHHIQDMSTAASLEHHWGFEDRALPCVSDKGTCEYLDAVYSMIDLTMLYTWIMWAVVGGVLLVMALLRYMKPSRSGMSQSSVYRGYRAVVMALRRWLLPETLFSVFGHVSRLQVAVLACTLVYLLIFSLVGITYRTWVTPIKASPGLSNTRSGIGGFADRVGAFAYALTPLTIALSCRESILSLITGIPYHHFNFLHRWTGRIIFVQSFLHTLMWTIVEGRLYQPQPTKYKEFMEQPYAIFGVVAMFFVTFLYVFSIKSVIRWTGYEFFKKTHYVVALLYMGACWGHWDKLACWMIASIGLMFLDLGCRILRLCLIHFGYKDGNKGKVVYSLSPSNANTAPGFGFRAAQSTLRLFDDGDATVLRLDFQHNHDAWRPGQHFFLCFPALNLWQSHPFTPSSLPAPHPASPHHTYLIRAEKGETQRLTQLARTLTSPPSSSASSATEAGEKAPTTTTTPIILTGPYGPPVSPAHDENILAVAGGTGITFALPIALSALAHPVAGSTRKIDLVWAIRRAQNVAWLAPELAELRARMLAGRAPGLRVRVFVTREDGAATAAAAAAAAAGVGVAGRDAKALEAGADVIAETAVGGKMPRISVDEDDESVAALLAPFRSGSASVGGDGGGDGGFETTFLCDHHPGAGDVVDAFAERVAGGGGACRVVGSGPAAMGRDFRSVIAERCRPGRVWRGGEDADWGLVWDLR
ncbi:uncharacterized protein K452DRAFT_335742 [Aplosporella prunicola CBS 121167]|uniref:ferric-chelate reductase (NADPH) n=1 Tax=Aplosporella prunicola CBS 121167 TaxID=1176127 RepID=A0A6A6BBI1_9PEZI|nr:uncharacterized protein K452DRAFT_335742 [Aplosporella prunicola CBS 121167]KAF2139841.1 hypothetical protein K452DRAFT_335742 [Aplosporella prunicola CBS 121167]